jgi:hypothetical protein
MSKPSRRMRESSGAEPRMITPWLPPPPKPDGSVTPGSASSDASRSPPVPGKVASSSRVRLTAPATSLGLASVSSMTSPTVASGTSSTSIAPSPSIATSAASKPAASTRSTSPGATAIANCPAASVVAVTPLGSARTVAPATGAPVRSWTTPRAVAVAGAAGGAAGCASAGAAVARVNAASKRGRYDTVMIGGLDVRRGQVVSPAGVGRGDTPPPCPREVARA